MQLLPIHMNEEARKIDPHAQRPEKAGHSHQRHIQQQIALLLHQKKQQHDAEKLEDGVLPDRVLELFQSREKP